MANIICKSWKGVKVEIKKKYYWNCCLKPWQGFYSPSSSEPTFSWFGFQTDINVMLFFYKTYWALECCQKRINICIVIGRSKARKNLICWIWNISCKWEIPTGFFVCLKAFSVLFFMIEVVKFEWLFHIPVAYLKSKRAISP